jgi:hypothetical protein
VTVEIPNISPSSLTRMKLRDLTVASICRRRSAVGSGSPFCMSAA